MHIDLLYNLPYLFACHIFYFYFILLLLLLLLLLTDSNKKVTDILDNEFKEDGLLPRYNPEGVSYYYTLLVMPMILSSPIHFHVLIG